MGKAANQIGCYGDSGTLRGRDADGMDKQSEKYVKKRYEKCGRLCTVNILSLYGVKAGRTTVTGEKMQKYWTKAVNIQGEGERGGENGKGEGKMRKGRGRGRGRENEKGRGGRGGRGKGEEVGSIQRRRGIRDVRLKLFISTPQRKHQYKQQILKSSKSPKPSKNPAGLLHKCIYRTLSQSCLHSILYCTTQRL